MPLRFSRGLPRCGACGAGHLVNAFGCFCACAGRVSTIIAAASSNPNLLRYRFVMSSLSPCPPGRVQCAEFSDVLPR